eukprot:scaffold66817_cov26-Tisochrysis_lutea.AAC.2
MTLHVTVVASSRGASLASPTPMRTSLAPNMRPKPPGVPHASTIALVVDMCRMAARERRGSAPNEATARCLHTGFSPGIAGVVVHSSRAPPPPGTKSQENLAYVAVVVPERMVRLAERSVTSISSLERSMLSGWAGGARGAAGLRECIGGAAAPLAATSTPSATSSCNRFASRSAVMASAGRPARLCASASCLSIAIRPRKSSSPASLKRSEAVADGSAPAALPAPPGSLVAPASVPALCVVCSASASAPASAPSPTSASASCCSKIATVSIAAAATEAARAMAVTCAASAATLAAGLAAPASTARACRSFAVAPTISPARFSWTASLLSVATWAATLSLAEDAGEGEAAELRADSCSVEAGLAVREPIAILVPALLTFRSSRAGGADPVCTVWGDEVVGWPLDDEWGDDFPCAATRHALSGRLGDDLAPPPASGLLPSPTWVASAAASRALASRILAIAPGTSPACLSLSASTLSANAPPAACDAPPGAVTPGDATGVDAVGGRFTTGSTAFSGAVGWPPPAPSAGAVPECEGRLARISSRGTPAASNICPSCDSR